MLLPALLEGGRKSGAIWYMILRQSPKRRQNLPGSVGLTQVPVLRLRIERAEASERLRRDLRRDTFGPGSGVVPAPASLRFRLR